MTLDMRTKGFLNLLRNVKGATIIQTGEENALKIKHFYDLTFFPKTMKLWNIVYYGNIRRYFITWGCFTNCSMNM